MCPFYPFHLIFLWGFLLSFLWITFGKSLTEAVRKQLDYSVTLVNENFNGSNSEAETVFHIKEGETKNLTFYIQNVPSNFSENIRLEEKSNDELSHFNLSENLISLKYDEVGKTQHESVEVHGSFLGFSKINFVLDDGNNADNENFEKSIEVKISRDTSTLDIIFVHMVIILLLLAYVNMGCAINIDDIKHIVKRPIAPCIGLFSQYLFMPLISYGIGYLLFFNRREFWLGLFLSGCVPGGGGSNMWTYILGGSLDLSITMTFFSTIFAFAALPIWVYAFGPSIMPDGYYGKLPYRNIAILIFGLLLPCCIGILIRKKSPKVADFLKRMLKPICVFFIVFVLTFGLYVKWYLFSFVTWQVAVGGFCLPILGYTFGGTIALLLRRDWEDVIAISVETGVQNTGLAIGVLKISLSNFSPMDDISILMPIAVATMTPVPLFAAYIIKTIYNKIYNSTQKKDYSICSPDLNNVQLCDTNKNDN